jgi:hypothetical protein
MSNNILLNKTATASNSVSPFSASKAIDGNNTAVSRWLCRMSGSSVALVVDAGASYWVNRWVVRHMGSVGWSIQYNMPSYTLQASLDNVNWTPVDSVAGNTANTTDRTFTTVLARYFRIVFPAGPTINPTLASIVGFEVYDAPSPVALSALAISSGTLTPAFSSTVLNYTASVPYETTSITVTPTASLPNTTITVNGTTVASGSASGAISLNVGSNTITIVVTLNGITQNYIIVVTRVDSSYLTALTAQSGTTAVALSPAPFVKTTMGYSATVGFNVSSITVTPTAEGASAVIKVNGTIVTSGQASASIPLAIGSNTIPVAVTAGGVTQNYSIAITRIDSSLSNLTGSLVPSGALTLSPSFLSTTFIYTALATGKGSIKLVPTASNAGSVIKVNGTQVASGASTTVSLVVGSNTVLITVTNSGVTTTYQLTVTR